MWRLIEPFALAYRGKGLITLLKRVWAIGKRYGLTAARMERSLAQLSGMLRQFDGQATVPITAVALARHGAVIREYQDRGIEFAVHGYRHVDYSQLPLEEQCAHLRQAIQVFRDHGVRFDGFRCPYLRWGENTLTALSQTHFTYDSSVSLFWDIGEEYTTSSYLQSLSLYGAQPAADYLALPYLDTARNLVCIPYCLPDDEALVERLKWRSSAEMNQVWPTIFHQIHQQGELFTLGLHPERVGVCASALIATLQQARAAAPAVWFAQLREIAAWWKARYTATVNITDLQDGVLQLTVSGPQGTTLLLRSLDGRTATEPWFDGYRLVSENPCTIRVNKRPFVGISPGTAPALIDFLKQQGYIPEVSSNQDLYALYFDRGSFAREDERPLIRQIEGGDFPLVRLGRWPHGARSAVCITGDIDAMSLWDYVLRILGG